LRSVVVIVALFGPFATWTSGHGRLDAVGGFDAAPTVSRRGPTGGFFHLGEPLPW